MTTEPSFKKIESPDDNPEEFAPMVLPTTWESAAATQPKEVKYSFEESHYTK